MSEKPQKQLVGWKQYLMTIGEKGLTYCLAAFMVFGGLIVSGAAIYGLSLPKGRDTIALLVLLGISIVGVLIGIVFFKGAREINPVAPITRHNTGHLPEVETLVRGSDRPATDQQSELLRAVRQGPETPPEQLLRATQESRQDV